MVILIVVCYLLIAVGELTLWAKRPWKQVLVYLLLLGSALLLSVLITINPNLAVPSPWEAIVAFYQKLGKWSGSR